MRQLWSPSRPQLPHRRRAQELAPFPPEARDPRRPRPPPSNTISEFLIDLGIEKPPRAGKACNDWSERRPHLAGKLGVALTSRLFELGWIRRTERRRAVRVTKVGRRELSARLDI